MTKDLLAKKVKVATSTANKEVNMVHYKVKITNRMARSGEPGKYELSTKIERRWAHNKYQAQSDVAMNNELYAENGLPIHEEIISIED